MMKERRHSHAPASSPTSSSLPFHIFSLSTGGSSPVKRVNELSGSDAKASLKLARCWTVRGLVGAITSTLPRLLLPALCDLASSQTVRLSMEFAFVHLSV